jgi:hypothetical protein
MIKLQNPFVTGGYVAPEYFCDRRAEVGATAETYRKREQYFVANFAVIILGAIYE